MASEFVGLRRRGGFVAQVPLEALTLAWELERRGFVLKADLDGITLNIGRADGERVTPEQLGDESVEGIRKWKTHLLGLLETPES